MYEELIEFYNEYGHLQKNHKEYPSLHDWMDIQRQRYHRAAKPDANQTARLAIPEIQIERLAEWPHSGDRERKPHPLQLDPGTRKTIQRNGGAQAVVERTIGVVRAD